MDAVADDCFLDLAAVAKINGNARHGADRLPVQDKVLAQIRRDFSIGVERGAKEPAVGTTIFFIQSAQEPQRKDRLATGLGRRLSLIKISVPVQPRSIVIPL